MSIIRTAADHRGDPRKNLYLFQSLFRDRAVCRSEPTEKPCCCYPVVLTAPVAGYMIAKRGVKIDAVYFHAPPYTSERAKQKVVDLAKLVARYSGPINLHVVNFTDIQLYIYDQCPHDELTIIMRRYMMKIAERIGKRDRAAWD